MPFCRPVWDNGVGGGLACDALPGLSATPSVRLRHRKGIYQMSDVVITDSDDSGNSPTEDLQVAAVAETAGSAAEANAAKDDAQDSEESAGESAETSAAAAVIAVQEAQVAAQSAAEAGMAANEVYAAISSLGQQVTDLRQAIDALGQQPQLTPVEQPSSDDEAPGESRSLKTPFLQRKWGSK